MLFQEQSFQEKSAWVMSFALIAAGCFYYWVVVSLSMASGSVIGPNAPFVIGYTGGLIVLAIIGHIIIAALSPKEANAELDERDRMISVRAGHLSGTILGVGVLLALGSYWFFRHGDVLYYAVFLSLMVSQVLEYLIQIYLYRSVVYS